MLARREDGYHEIESVVCPIDLMDRLEARRRDEPGVVLETSGRPCPDGDDNLVVRAARRLLEERGTPDAGVLLRLEKRIPLGAGLGGGSADAAAALRVVDRLLGLATPPEALLRLAAELGSDVPFFLGEGWAILRGRGDRVEPFPFVPEPVLHLVVLHPRKEVSTAAVYRRLNLDLTRPKHDLKTWVQLMAFGEPGGVRGFWNSLATPFRELHPELALLLDRAERRSGRRFFLTGSGSAAFAVVPGPEEGEAVRGRLRDAQLDVDVFVCRTLSRGDDRGGGPRP